MGALSLKKIGSVAGLGKRRHIPETTNDCYPARRCSLPGALIFAAYIGAVDQLIAIDSVPAYHHAQRGIDNTLEANRNLAEVKIDVGYDLAGLHGDGIECKAVIVAGEQVGGQHLIARVVAGLIENAIVETCTVGTGGEHCGTSHIIGDFIMPEERLQRHIRGIGNRQVIAHGLTGHDLCVTPFGDGNAKICRLIVGGDFDDLTGIFQRYIMHGGVDLPERRRCDFADLVAR